MVTKKQNSTQKFSLSMLKSSTNSKILKGIYQQGNSLPDNVEAGARRTQTSVQFTQKIWQRSVSSPIDCFLEWRFKKLSLLSLAIAFTYMKYQLFQILPCSSEHANYLIIVFLRKTNFIINLK